MSICRIVRERCGPLFGNLSVLLEITMLHFFGTGEYMGLKVGLLAEIHILTNTVEP